MNLETARDELGILIGSLTDEHLRTHAQAALDALSGIEAEAAQRALDDADWHGSIGAAVRAAIEGRLADGNADAVNLTIAAIAAVRRTLATFPSEPVSTPEPQSLEYAAKVAAETWQRAGEILQPSEPVSTDGESTDLEDTGEGVLAGLVGVESALDDARERLREAQVTLAGGLNRAFAAKRLRLPLPDGSPSTDLPSEYGRLLAERDRLVSEGVDPADLDIPVPPPLPDGSPSTEPREQQIERLAAALHGTDPLHQKPAKSGWAGGAAGLAECPDRVEYTGWAAALYDAGLRASTEPPRPGTE